MPLASRAMRLAPADGPRPLPRTLMNEPSTAPDSSLTAFLVGQRLAHPGEPVQWHALAGGVSSDIWQVELPGRSVCIKRALPQLKVAAEWLAPVDRNSYE